MSDDGKGYRTITGSGSESPPSPTAKAGLGRPMATTDVGDHLWAACWHKREALLRDLIACWRTPAVEPRALTTIVRDVDRARCADELEAVLDAAEPIAHGRLPS